MLRSDSTRPRLTCYDDGPGPSAGERVELSARVLGNWVAKAGNCLQDELDAGRGTRVLLALPTHWRAFYWALAVWSVGATVRLAPSGEALPLAADCDVVVSDEVSVVAAAQGPSVLVSLPMLSRSHPDTPTGAVDEARELATYGDVFDPWDAAEPDDAGLLVRDVSTPHGGWSRLHRSGGHAPGSCSTVPCRRCCPSRSRPGRRRDPWCCCAVALPTRPPAAPPRE